MFLILFFNFSFSYYTFSLILFHLLRILFCLVYIYIFYSTEKYIYVGDSHKITNDDNKYMYKKKTHLQCHQNLSQIEILLAIYR